MLGEALGEDVEASIETAIAAGAVFEGDGDASVVYRRALDASIRDVESHPRGRLFQEFLRKGPYEHEDEIPNELCGQRLADEDVAAAITFAFSHMVNCFKGELAELLALRPCVELVGQLQRNGAIPESARLYLGDSVSLHGGQGRGVKKGADQHILMEEECGQRGVSVTVVGVTEVKSYYRTQARLRPQMDRHLRRATHGMRIGEVDVRPSNTQVGLGAARRTVRIAVVPGEWKLSRRFRFESSERGRQLDVEAREPRRVADEVTRVADDEWRVCLRWSQEALAEAAFEMTHWYMGKVGEHVYSQSVPADWQEMGPAAAGRNAAKMMLYYAIPRCKKATQRQKAIALYNSYGFGYALGMNFRDSEGKRDVLFPEDLDEILLAGRTRHGSRIH